MVTIANVSSVLQKLVSCEPQRLLGCVIVATTINLLFGTSEMSMQTLSFNKFSFVIICEQHFSIQFPVEYKRSCLHAYYDTTFILVSFLIFIYHGI